MFSFNSHIPRTPPFPKPIPPRVVVPKQDHNRQLTTGPPDVGAPHTPLLKNNKTLGEWGPPTPDNGPGSGPPWGGGDY